jgi:hypothetical protein
MIHDLALVPIGQRVVAAVKIIEADPRVDRLALLAAVVSQPAPEPGDGLAAPPTAR